MERKKRRRGRSKSEVSLAGRKSNLRTQCKVERQEWVMFCFGNFGSEPSELGKEKNSSVVYWIDK